MRTGHPTGSVEDGKNANGGGSATERLLTHLGTRLDGLDAGVRESLLLKAFLLLADAHGDVATAITCLEEAANSGHGAQDDAL